MESVLRWVSAADAAELSTTLVYGVWQYWVRACCTPLLFALAFLAVTRTICRTNISPTHLAVLLRRLHGTAVCFVWGY